MKNSVSYLRFIDGLRFFCFLFVFSMHAIKTIEISLTSLPLFFARVLLAGWAGVDFFFLISAYLLTKLLTQEFTETGMISLSKFWIRRCLRIWPLYFFCLIIAFAFLPFFNTELMPQFSAADYTRLLKMYLPAAVAFLGNFAIPLNHLKVGNFIGPTWSICAEEQFYIVWPIGLAWLLANRGKKTNLPVYLSVGLIMLTFGTKLLIHAEADEYNWSYMNTLCRLEPFVLGSALAIYDENILRLVHAMPRVMTWVLTLCGLAIFSLTHYFLRDPWFNDFSSVFIYSLNAVCFTLIFVSIRYPSRSKIREVLSHPVLVGLGKRSYGLYMLHSLSIRFTLNYATKAYPLFHSTTSVQVGGAAVALILSIFASELSFRLIEKPFLRMKPRFNVLRKAEFGTSVRSR